MGHVNVHVAPLPFASKNVKKIFAEGKTIAEIIDEICPEDIRQCTAAVVMINDRIVPKQAWSTTVPKCGDIIAVRVIPAKGGGKSILTSVLAIAVVVAAPMLGAAIGASISASAFAGAGIATAIDIGTVVGGIVGLVAASALMSVPSQTTTTDPTEGTTQFVEGASNALNPYGVVPICLGTNRMYPPQAATPYTESENNDQYVRQLFTWGCGEHIEVSNLKIGDTDLEDFSDYEIEHKLEGDLNEGTSLYSNDVNQDNYSVLLEQAAGYVERTVHSNANEAVIDFTFASGLCVYNSSGNRTSQTVQIEVAYAVTGSGSWTGTETLTYTGTTAEALRVSHRFVFPSTGNYDVRCKRITADATEDTVIDKVYLTAVRSVTYTVPVNAANICGTAIRIKATDQLNGTIDQFNGVVSQHISDYDLDTDSWITRATSNPASIYRFVLQGVFNAKALPDEKISITALEEWHTWCDERGYTYNRVIDSEMSVDDVLRDIAAAGRASPSVLDGLRTVVVDRPKDDIVQVITPRNSWDYKGEMTPPDLPHALRVTFRDADSNYETAERIVYDDGYDEETATLFEQYTVESCTNSDLAYKDGRNVFALAKLRPETHTVTMDMENLVATRGDRVILVHDVPIVGVGEGRIKEVLLTDADPEIITTEGGDDITTEGSDPITTEGDWVVSGLVLDDVISIPSSSATYYARIRLQDGSWLYKELTTTVGTFTELTFAEPFDPDDAPNIGDLCVVYEAGGQLDCIITRIEPQSDLSATLTLQNYAPDIYDAETGSIPPWVSGITTPLELVRLNAPVLISSQSDETVLIKNSDGSFTSRAVFTLENTNEGEIITEVKVRRTGDTQFKVAEVLDSSTTKVSVTGLADGTRYDFRIWYHRANGGVYSLPLQINNYLFVGVSSPPSDIEDFTVVASGETMIFQWDAVSDIDFSHYEMRYSPLYTGATWDDSQVAESIIYENRVTRTALGGTYFLKAVDLSGNYSTDAAVIISYNYNTTTGVVETLTESSTFTGVKDNVEVNGGILTLTDLTSVGYYYFDNELDLLGVFPALLTAETVAYGLNVSSSSELNNIFDMSDLFSVEDLFGIGTNKLNNIFDMSALFSVEDLFGIGTNNWSARVEYSYTEDDPSDSAAVWSDWAPLLAGSVSLQGARFRLRLESFEQGITPAISTLAVNVSMQTRIERGDDLTVPTTGATVSYVNEFYKNPAVSILLQNADVDDKIEFVNKDADGFTFKVYNTTSAAYVERTYDYIASGYGRTVI